ncbi:MAG: hypothetical protein ABR574_02770 [Cryomorphaceae bacterium]|nr:hypothetical protein [Flavobacteriales bacterium]
MINQKKCPACGKWTDGSKQRCVFCNSLIDPQLIAEEDSRKRAEKSRQERLASESKFEKYLRKLKESDKPGYTLLFKILNTLFNIYMAVLSFFIWLIALISG